MRNRHFIQFCSRTICFDIGMWVDWSCLLCTRLRYCQTIASWLDVRQNNITQASCTVYKLSRAVTPDLEPFFVRCLTSCTSIINWMIIVTNETKVWAVFYGVTYHMKWLLQYYRIQQVDTFWVKLTSLFQHFYLSKWTSVSDRIWWLKQDFIFVIRWGRF